MQAEKVIPLNGHVRVEMAYGTVQALCDGRYIVHGDNGECIAKRAFSCVVQPEPGDRVMYSFTDYETHILAVIDRPNNSDATLSFQGDVTLHTQQGKISIAGDEGVQLASSDEVTMVSKELNVVANKGVVNVADLTTVGEQISSNIKWVKLFASSIDTVAERLSLRLKHSFRQIEGVDQTKAGEMLTTIKNLFSLRSRQTAILAKKDIKVDAERIHMG